MAEEDSGSLLSLSEENEAGSIKSGSVAKLSSENDSEVWSDDENAAEKELVNITVETSNVSVGADIHAINQGEEFPPEQIDPIIKYLKYLEEEDDIEEEFEPSHTSIPEPKPPRLKQWVFKLNSNYYIPMVGFGTYNLTDPVEIMCALDWALSAGYRLFDTATAYNNEREIGKAFQKLLPLHKLQREDIFITSKLGPRDHDDGVKGALLQTLEDLQCSYLDLYLIHWPGSPEYATDDPMNGILRDKSWAALAMAKSLGYVRSIGVSNYTTVHLQELLYKCHGVKPSVNQIEWHPYCWDNDMRNLCRQHKILIQGYFSLGGPQKKLLTKKSQKIKRIAESYGVKPAQILLRWSLQKGVGVIPRGRTEQEIIENKQLDFHLCCDCMKGLNKMKKMRFGIDPHEIM